MYVRTFKFSAVFNSNLLSFGRLFNYGSDQFVHPMSINLEPPFTLVLESTFLSVNVNPLQITLVVFDILSPAPAGAHRCIYALSSLTLIAGSTPCISKDTPPQSMRKCMPPSAADNG